MRWLFLVLMVLASNARSAPLDADESVVFYPAMGYRVEGGKKLSRSALKEINEAPAVYVSAISGFEISLKVRQGRLELSLPVEKWFGQVMEHHGLTILPLELEACIAAAELPAIHDDPFDRFIIAAAKRHDLTVVTKDEQFEKYGVTVIG